MANAAKTASNVPEVPATEVDDNGTSEVTTNGVKTGTSSEPTNGEAGIKAARFKLFKKLR